MTRPRIILDVASPGEVRARAAEFLGPAWFGLYRKACEAGGARWLKSAGGNVAPLTQAPRLREHLEHAGFEVLVDGSLARALSATSAAARDGLGALRKRLDDADAVLRREGASLGQYQREGAAWLTPCDRALLGDQQGLGKTLQLLLAIPEGSPGLVICPSVAKGVWSRECRRFRPDLTPVFLSGIGSARWPRPGELVILNYEIQPETPEECAKAREASTPIVEAEAFWAYIPDGVTLIADEAHYLKSNKTKRTDRARSLVKAVLKRGGRVWPATGTPLLNRPLELWNLLVTFQLHRDSFGSFMTFAELFGALKNRWGQYVWPDASAGISPAIAERLRRVILRRLRKDVLPDLPAKIRQDVPVEITAGIRKMADAALAALAARGITLEDAVAAAELGRMTDPAFIELSRAREQLARALIPAALELAESYEESGEPVIFWSDHRAPVEAFRGRPGWALIEGGMTGAQKTAIEEAFQRGDFKGLACSIKAGGTAITLTRAAHEVFVDLSYVPGENEQAEDRCVRHGQTRGVLIRRLVPDHRIAKDLIEIVTGKMQLIAGTVDAAAVTKVTLRVDVAELEKMSKEAP